MKRIFLISITLLLGVSAWSQQSPRFGFQLSPVVSRLTTDNSRIATNGTNVGLKLGMIGEFGFGPDNNYSFTTGIGFHFNAGGSLLYDKSSIDSVQIWQETDIPGVSSFFKGGANFKYSLQYVEIPFGLKMRTREIGHIRYYIEPGLALAIRSQARGNITNISGIDPAEKFNISSAVNLLNLSWGLGAGIEYGLSENTALVGGLAFQSGFLDVSRNKGTTLVQSGESREEDSKAKLMVLALRLGIMF